MKISKLKIKNILGIQEINFEPGNITIIEGESGSGKTSILESIQRTIIGKSERDCFVNTVTDGVGEVYLVFDENINLTKKYNQDGKNTTKLTRNEISVKAPNTFIKGLVNEYQLNPVELIKMSDKDLTELILELIDIRVPDDIINKIGIQVDNSRHGLKVCEEIENTLYEKRTDINREIKLIDGEIQGYKDKIPENYNVEYAKSIDLKNIFEEISNANKTNSDIQKAKNIINEKNSKIENIREKSEIEIKNLLDKIESIKENTKSLIDKENEIVMRAEKFLDNIDKCLEGNEEINVQELEDKYREKEKYKSFIGIADELENKKLTHARKKEESEALTKKIELIRNLPIDLLSKVEMPIDNLTYKDGNILISNRPIINLSGGERIKFVMDIVRAISGDLKLILINGFESLNQNEQRQFIENCKDDGFQYFITRTCDSKLNILDGETGEIL